MPAFLMPSRQHDNRPKPHASPSRTPAPNGANVPARQPNAHKAQNQDFVTFSENSKKGRPRLEYAITPAHHNLTASTITAIGFIARQ